MVKFAVCNDEQEMIDCISDKLRAYYSDECEIKTYADGASLLSDCRQNCFDVLFLDVDMPGLNGMEIAEIIRENDRRVIIIFVSSQNELAYKGYIYDAFRFVRKSNLEHDLCEAVKSLNEIFPLQSDYLVFKTSKGEIVRAAKDIKYFKANSHSIDVVCNDRTIQINGTLREYEERLRNHSFVRIHKSYLVNFRYIRSVEKNAVFLMCGEKLPLSRHRISDAKMKMMFFQET